MRVMKDNSITFLSYNIWGLKIGPFGLAKNLKERIAELPAKLSSTGADIIFLQEVWRKKDQFFLISKMKELGYHFAFYQESAPFWVKKIKIARV